MSCSEQTSREGLSRDGLSDDHQILTNLGFMGINELLRRKSAVEVLVAGYCRISGRISYEPVEHIVYKPSRKREMVHVTAQHGVSALVMPTHDIYWREGDTPFAKRQARELHTGGELLVRVLAPYRPITRYEAQMRTMGIGDDVAKRTALSALYGAWLRGGALQRGEATLVFPEQEIGALAGCIGLEFVRCEGMGLIIENLPCASLFCSDEWPSMLSTDMALKVLETFGTSFQTYSCWCRDVVVRLCLHAGLVSQCVHVSKSNNIHYWVVEISGDDERKTPRVCRVETRVYEGITWCVGVQSTMIVTRHVLGHDYSTPIVVGIS